VPAAKKSVSTAKPATSAELQALAKRVRASSLSGDDRTTVSEILNHSIKLKKLVEKASDSIGGKKIIARLPGGFDIVK
jgi:hypothetical protein